MMGEGARRYRTPYPVLVSLLLAVAVFGGQTPQQSSTQNQQTDQKQTDQKTDQTQKQSQADSSRPAMQKADPKTGVDPKTGLPTVTGSDGQKDLKLGTQLVNVPVTVTDPYGRFVTGLDQSNFEVYEDKIKQAITFFSDSDAPVSIGIVFDVSGSMKSRINRSHEALQKFVDASHEDDDFFLVAFNSYAKVIKDFTTDGRGVANALTLVEPKGSTALYDAAYIAVEKVRQGRHTRKALIIISDGMDNNSRYTYSELRKIVKEADVQIYALGITDLFGGGSEEMGGEAILEEITRMTGGRAFFPTNEVDLEDSITRIALELRHQYSLGYVPQDGVHDGRYRKLRVTVNPPKGMPHLTVRFRDGYFGQKATEPVVTK